jgi:putative transposase
MTTHYFCKDAEINLDGRAYLMKQEVEDGLWQIEEMRTGRIHEFKLQELQQQYAEGKLVFIGAATSKISTASTRKSRVDNRNVDEPEWNKAKIRRVYAKAIEHLPSTEKVVKQVIEQVWKKMNITKLPPHWVTVCKWKQQYISYGKDAFSLAAQHHNKGNRNDRYPKEVIEIVEDCIERIYLQRERSTIEDTLEEAVVRIYKENQQRPTSMQLAVPTRRLVTRLIQKIPAFDRYAARYGRLAANRKFRSKLKHWVTNRPLEAAEIDHTQLDLFVIDDGSHMPLGRPWITICIDRHTRCILGIHIGFEPPSYLTVGKCLKHAFLPKVNLKTQYPDIRYEWHAHGVMDQLIVDNGMEFHSAGLEQACYSFGVEIVYTPRKTPWFKGMIERFNGTLNRGVSHGIQGTSFSNIFEKDDYDPVKHAVLTLSDLRYVIHKWIADYYHQKPHRGLDQLSPATMWQTSILPQDIQMAHDPAQIDMLLGKAVPDKTVTHKGVEINNLLYNSPELMQLRRQRGDTFKVDIRIDESNLGHLYVMLEQGNGYIEVPALHIDYANGMTLWLHKLCRNYAKTQWGKNDVYTWALAKTEIRERVEKSLNLKRKRVNSRVGRYQDTRPVEVHQSSPSSLTKQTAALPVIEPLLDLTEIVRPTYVAVIEPRV